MQKLSTLVLLLAFSVSYGQWFGKETIKDSGNIISKERTVSSYNQVVNSTFLDVVLTDEKMGKVRVEASDNLEPYILTKVENNTLKVELEPKKSFNVKHKAVVYIPVNQDLKRITMTGSGDIMQKHTLNVDKLECSVTGSGDVEINLNANELHLKVTGSGDIEAQGSTKMLNVQVTGSGDVKASKLKALNVLAIVSGSGDIEVYAQNEIKAQVTGSGEISVKGKPAKQDTKVTGSGEVKFE